MTHEAAVAKAASCCGRPSRIKINFNTNVDSIYPASH